ncbi:MAG: hypothetical protein AAFV88_11650 [Planctomycetota bacterium]
MSSENMELWNKVCKTPEERTKPFQKGRKELTEINQQWQLQQATEIWGPYGKDWGLKNLRFEVIEVQDSADGVQYSANMLMLNAEFFYPQATFAIANDAQLRVGQDCVKMLVTNTRSKALSWLGFGADVFMGEFDGPIESASAKPDPVFAKIEKRLKEATTLEDIAWCRTKIEEMAESGTITAIAADQLHDLCNAAEAEMPF